MQIKMNLSEAITLSMPQPDTRKRLRARARARASSEAKLKLSLCGTFHPLNLRWFDTRHPTPDASYERLSKVQQLMQIMPADGID